MDKPEALRLTDAIDPLTRRNLDNLTCAAAAAELRRQHGEIKSMRTERLRSERRLSAVEAQRDALLEALKAAEPYLRHADVDYNVYVQCRAAIKAAEETK